jgi:hypothetical protein
LDAFDEDPYSNFVKDLNAPHNLFRIAVDITQREWPEADRQYAIRYIFERFSELKSEGQLTSMEAYRQVGREVSFYAWSKNATPAELVTCPRLFGPLIS